MHLEPYLCCQLTIMLYQGKFYHPTVCLGCPLHVWNVSWMAAALKRPSMKYAFLSVLYLGVCFSGYWIHLDPFLLKMGGIFNSSGPSFASRHDPCKFV